MESPHFILPILFAVGTWNFAIDPETARAAIPPLWIVPSHSPIAPPAYPKTKLQAWDLGALSAMAMMHNKSREETSDIAAEILQTKTNITFGDLLEMRSQIIAVESRRSLLQRVKGFFTFVNFLWLISIVGIALTASPVLR